MTPGEVVEEIIVGFIYGGLSAWLIMEFMIGQYKKILTKKLLDWIEV